MKVLVCGGRDYTNTQKLYSILDEIHRETPVDLIIEGDARGADRMAGYWAKKNKVDLKLFPADWEKHGKGAGHIRNRQMLEEGQPDLIVAFPGGQGTANMKSLAKYLGYTVLVIE